MLIINQFVLFLKSCLYSTLATVKLTDGLRRLVFNFNQQGII
jgi:hypothetical protein